MYVMLLTFKHFRLNSSVMVLVVTTLLPICMYTNKEIQTANVVPSLNHMPFRLQVYDYILNLFLQLFRYGK